jgi:hypothetical protein
MRFNGFLAAFFTLVFVSVASAKITPNTDEATLKRQLLSAMTQNFHSVGYNSARVDLLGEMALQQANGRFFVKDVYCEANYPSPGPGRIPSNNIMNVEHTWPQSKFSGNKGDQKADLHHLYPSDPELNSIRGNNPFGVVAKPIFVTKCPVSQIGDDANGVRVFEPPMAHKGNVARALFYFSVRYSLRIDANQEATLKQWNMDDPPDAEELARNNAVEKFQGNRNPFIDQPELANSISDF